MATTGYMLANQKKHFWLEIPNIQSNKKCVVMSVIGNEKTGKSTFINGLVSYIAQVNTSIFDVDHNLQKCTYGVEYLTLDLPNFMLIILDCEGLCIENYHFVLPFVYVVSDLIVYNDTGIINSGVYDIIREFGSFASNVDKHTKPLFLFRIADYSLNASPSELLKLFIKCGEESLNSSLSTFFTMFLNIDIVTTEQLGKKGKNLLQNKKYLDVINDENYGFISVYDSILKMLNSIEPTLFLDIESGLEDSLDLINKTQLEKYNNNFANKVLKYIDDNELSLEVVEAKLFPYEDAKSEYAYKKLDAKISDLQKGIQELRSTNERFSEFLDADLEIERIKLYTTKEIVCRAKLNCVELADRYIADTLDETLETYMFKYFNSLKIFGNQCKYSETESDCVENIKAHYREKFVCDESISKLERNMITLMNSLTEKIGTKIGTELELYEKIIQNVNDCINDIHIDSIFQEKIQAVTKINKSFEYFFGNFVVDYENKICLMLEDSIFSYEVSSVSYDKSTFEGSISFEKQQFFCTQPTENLFKDVISSVKSKVIQLTSNINNYKTLYNDYIVSSLRLGENCLGVADANPKICFSSLLLRGNSEEENWFATVIKLLRENNFHVNEFIRYNRYKSEVHIFDFSKNIEDMLKFLCNYVDVDYNFIINETYSYGSYTKSNLFKCAIDSKNVMQKRFVERVIDKYFTEKYLSSKTNDSSYTIKINNQFKPAYAPMFFGIA